MNDISADRRLASIAGAIADPSRSRMLCILLDGRARTATELATLADIAASTASAHFTRLQRDGLIEGVRQGRHRYFRIGDAGVAHALEILLGIAARDTSAVRVNGSSPLRHARTCYDHCAGALGVALHDAMLRQHWLAIGDDGYSLQAKGTAALAALGIETQALARQRRRLVYPCLDWSERRPHLGGALGAALLSTMITRRWLYRDLDSRVLYLTTAGMNALPRRFGIDPCLLQSR